MRGEEGEEGSLECTPKVRHEIKGPATLNGGEVARMYQLSPKRLETWRSEWHAKGDLAFPGKGAQPQSKLNADRISELERKIGQQTMEIDFLKKTLRRFREHPRPVAVNGGSDSMSKSKRQPKRGQP